MSHEPLIRNTAAWESGWNHWHRKPVSAVVLDEAGNAVKSRWAILESNRFKATVKRGRKHHCQRECWPIGITCKGCKKHNNGRKMKAADVRRAT